ncbi:GNAT family N-acetyltransferase (plasmid) [Sphingomonas paeninsulae]|uniref:Acyl-homoserine-lactone synthase n=1 Tax=Sphingomonas paeninsulae TaxID=2319844 RepID=A0A494TCH3_SPHPE|nr:acyl-homoserine-lactone synthase [Sphingomonas paeninsulae]AYJ84954.1 GNAT family N-acetyltransferase [Sphingomonas paeninsulae]
MLITVSESNHIHQSEVLRAMFEARKQVFIDLLKWRLPVVAERFEIDQFDDRHAVYLILTDTEGRHLGSARLLASVRPGLLNTLFADLCDFDMPVGPDVYEITRFCLSRSLRASARRIVRDQLVTAIARHALVHGITTYTGIAEWGWMQQIMSFGWQCRPLGLLKEHEGAMLGALRIDIAADTIAQLAAAGISDGSEMPMRKAA